MVAGRAVMIGKPRFLRDQKVVALEPLEALAVKLQETGKTAMFVAIDGAAAGLIAVADPIKSTTPEAIRELHALGYASVVGPERVVFVTDHEFAYGSQRAVERGR